MLAACEAAAAGRHRRLRRRRRRLAAGDRGRTVKIKKGEGGPPAIGLVENPDILATLSQAGPHRPKLVIGFAAETDDVEAHAKAKLARKGCDWIVANDVTVGHGHHGRRRQRRPLVTAEEGGRSWPPTSVEG